MTARRWGALAGLTGLLALAVLASLAFGAKPIPPDAVWDALRHHDGSENATVVRELRVPRTILGIIVGVSLGVAGALMQGHTRNPLAEPGLLGVSAGAAFAVVLGIHVIGVGGLAGYIWFAFAGAFVASVVVFLIGSTGGGGPTPVTLALSGVAVSSLLSALTTAVLLSDRDTADLYRFWTVGSLAGRDLSVAVPVLPFLLAGLVLAAANARGLDILSLGEDVARGLGHRVGLIRAVGLTAITLLTGAAVAAAGPIWFVGLVVPHVARAFGGADHRWLLPMAGLAGAVLLLVADVAARLVARPGELNVGIVLAVIGAPFFIVLVRRRKLMQL